MVKLAEELRDLALPVLRLHGVSRAALFGSCVRGDARPDSDVDLLVELDDRLSLLDVIRLKHDLEDVLGRTVDLVEYEMLKPRLREQVLREQVPIL